MENYPKKFRYRLLLPVSPAVIELGETTLGDFMHFVETYDWDFYLKKEEQIGINETINTLSIEVENVEWEQFLKISNMGRVGQHHFMVLFKRPVVKTYFWGLFSHVKKGYQSYRRLKDASKIPEMIRLFFKGELEEV